jgi:hypothetical protein
VNVAHLFSHPHRLSPAERQEDALQALENRERYVLQSEKTLDNAPAPIPPRPALAGDHH